VRFSVYCLAFNTRQKQWKRLTFNPGVTLTGFQTSRSCFRQVNLTWTRDPIKNQYLVSGKLKKYVTSMSSKREPAIWSSDAGQRMPFLDRCQLVITRNNTLNQGCTSLSIYHLEYGRHLARLRRRSNAPTSNTASHDNHEKIHSWVSFSFLYEHGAPLSGPWAAGAPLILDLGQPKSVAPEFWSEFSNFAVRFSVYCLAFCFEF